MTEYDLINAKKSSLNAKDRNKIIDYFERVVLK